MNFISTFKSITDFIFSKKDIFLYAILFSMLFSILFFLDKGLIFFDEAYYLFRHYEDIYQINNSNWFKISNQFFKHIIYDRFIVYMLLITSSFSLGYTHSRYIDSKYSPFKIGLWCIIAQFILVVPISFSPNYINFSVFISNFIFSFLFAYMHSKNKVLLYLMGVFYGLLFFIYITSVIVILPIILILIIQQPKFKSIIKELLVITAGILSTFLIYFNFVEPLEDYIFEIYKVIEYQKYDSNHGLSAMLMWLLNIIKNGAFVFAYLVFEYIKSKKPMHRYLVIVTYAIFILAAFYYLAYSVGKSVLLFQTQIFYMFLVYLIFNTKEYSNKVILLHVILAITPLFLSFGTDIDFFVRSVKYFPFIFLALFYFSKYSNMLSKLMAISIIAICILFFASTFFRHSWGGYKLLDQTEKYTLSENNYIKLDQSKIDKLDELEPYIAGEDNVVPLSERLWGYLYLLEAKPLFLYYRPNNSIQHYINENNIDYNTLVLLGEKGSSLSLLEISNMVGISTENLEVRELEHFNIYYYEKRRMD